MGYCGGTQPDPTYHHLGDHTETTQIDFDPQKISFDQILDRIWASHNPCGASFSRQYMSAIFYHNEAQRKAIEGSKARLETKLGRIVNTAILPLTRFYLAEDYHQKYELRSNAELMREFSAIYPDPKEFVNSTAAARVNGYLAGHGTAEQLRSEIDLLGLSAQGKAELRKYVP